jgi:hypothetical protein
MVINIFTKSSLIGSWNEVAIVIFTGPIVYWTCWILYARTIHPLVKVPGPLWPAVSRTWLMYRMYQGDLEIHMRVMHDRFDGTCAEI